MPPLNLLIKPVSGNCNMKCDYCFYCEEMENREQASFGSMSEETLELILKKALDRAEKSCTVAFQGGEPTLRGLDFFKKAVELEKRYNVHGLSVHNALQTNGLGLDREWAEFFAENHFLIGLSIDGRQNSHDAYRKTKGMEDTFEAVNRTAQLFTQCGVDFNVLTVVNDRTVKQARRIYQFYQKMGWKYLQFIPCLPPLKPDSRSYSPNVFEYGTFLNDLFDCWYTDLKQGKQPYIRQFENYVGILLGEAPDCCDQSGICQIQYVVEADGSVFPCDFYAMDEYCLGNLRDMVWEEIDGNRKKIKFVENSVAVRQGCGDCRYYPLCRGGCTRCFRQDEDGNRKNYFCQSYQMFFQSNYKNLTEIAETILTH